MTRATEGLRRVLVVDDDADVRAAVCAVVRKLADEIVECADGASGVHAALEQGPSLMLLDLSMPDMTGLEVLSAVKADLPDLPVIVVSGSSTVDTAVEAMRYGARDFVTKPFLPARLEAAVRNALELGALGRRVGELEEALADARPYARLVGCSGSMNRLVASLRKLGRSSATVLIQGETGVGKELVARALHTEGARAQGPFVDVNCAAIPAELLENELFGHEREAFTGANRRRMGKIEAADGGTLFLDEVGELDLSSQAKLLRVLQDRRVERLGSTGAVPVDVRVVAATNRNLSDEVARGTFRADLYYRLSVYPVYVPPLRERKEDIPSLVHHFVEIAARAEQRATPALAGDAMALLMAYEWPGNARELENVIRRAMIALDDDVIGESDLPVFLRGAAERAGMGACTPSSDEPVPAIPRSGGAAAHSATDDSWTHSQLEPLSEMERRHVERMLERCQGNLSETARALGIGRTTLYRKLEKYGLRSRCS